ncbi:MAG: glycine--tRNA ligase [SAR324 cluster bacterium]|uniref:Glycine--tRNA ligase n=1 Tax=SAR324 cluster bacterium TaxID=2024889 RepID=A0A7X9IKF4_9DELT|nr:glycine--tRNA ligase [SAR324 cluster bacterium]
MNDEQDILSKLVSLAKRRGFIFQSSEIYGGLKSAYDYGPLGVELKRNISSEWWKAVVHEREDIVGLDASIIMHPTVWKASGHLAGFSDPLVDCRNCKERFRADKAPKVEAGTELKWRKGGKKDGELIVSKANTQGYVCPQCGSNDLSDERQFNLMFRTSLGPVDPLEDAVNQIAGKNLGRKELREALEEAFRKSAVYLRPETAQGIFVQFANVQSTMSIKIPFGIAQIGKAFRNEIVTEKFIFRTCEFEQMEIEYFVEPGTQSTWHEYWKEERMKWWQSFANNKDAFRFRQHDKDELAHYSDNCYDIDFRFPWGWDELEGIASRTDYDLSKHSAESGVKLSYFDQQKTDPETGKLGWRYVPYVIEPSAGLTRGTLAVLLDAYTEEKGVDANGQEKTRVLLKLHPKLAPIKVAVFPLLKKDGLPEVARDIVKEFFKARINARYDEQHSIGKRYSRHDEVGTPYCLTIDHQTLQDKTVTIRDRDTTMQDRISIDEALYVVKARIEEAS